MKQIDFDAYFDKIHTAIETKITSAATAKIDSLKAEIKRLQANIKTDVEQEFMKKIADLVKNEVIDEKDAKEVFAKYGIKAPMKRKAVTPTPTQTYGCGGGASFSRSC